MRVPVERDVFDRSVRLFTFSANLFVMAGRSAVVIAARLFTFVLMRGLSVRLPLWSAETYNSFFLLSPYHRICA